MEGWHNRLQILIGRHHPTFYRFLVELIDEQAKTDYDLRELDLGHSIKSKRKKSQIAYEERIYNIVSNFAEYYANDNLLGYLRALGSHVSL